MLETEEKHMHVQNREREAANLPDLDPPDPTRPATLTRTDFTFPTTVLAELGTDLKLRSRPSFPCHPHCRKRTGTPAIEA